MDLRSIEVFQIGLRGEDPAAIHLTGEMIGADPAGGNQQIVGQGFQRAIEFELASTVVSFGGFGEHFDDEGGIQQRVTLFVHELWDTADNNDIRIYIQTRCVTWTPYRLNTPCKDGREFDGLIRVRR